MMLHNFVMLLISSRWSPIWLLAPPLMWLPWGDWGMLLIPFITQGQWRPKRFPKSPMELTVELGWNQSPDWEICSSRRRALSRVQPTSQACLDLGMRKSTRKEAKGRSLLQTQFPKESSGMQCLLPRDLLVEATGIASWRIMILEVAIEKLSCIMPTLDSDSKESPCNVGDPGLIPGLGRSTREGKSHGQRSLVGYSLWGYKESDMTEQLTLSLFFFFHAHHDGELALV